MRAGRPPAAGFVQICQGVLRPGRMIVRMAFREPGPPGPGSPVRQCRQRLKTGSGSDLVICGSPATGRSRRTPQAGGSYLVRTGARRRISVNACTRTPGSGSGSNNGMVTARGRRACRTDLTASRAASRGYANDRVYLHPSSGVQVHTVTGNGRWTSVLPGTAAAGRRRLRDQPAAGALSSRNVRLSLGSGKSTRNHRLLPSGSRRRHRSVIGGR